MAIGRETWSKAFAQTSRMMTGLRISLDVNELIREALSLERSDLQKHDTVEAETASQLPEVHGNRVQLQQVLINLIKMPSTRRPRMSRESSASNLWHAGATASLSR